MSSERPRTLLIICAMFALSPLAPMSAMAGATWRAGGARVVEVESTGELEARRARLALARQVGWGVSSGLTPCPAYGADALCTRVEVTNAAGGPVRGLVGQLTVGFAADALALDAQPITENEPGVYLSPAAPDRPGLWDVRLVVGAREDAPPAFELVERVEF